MTKLSEPAWIDHSDPWAVRSNTESDVTVSDEYVGTFAAMDENGVPVSITIEAADVNYYFCLRDMFRFKNPVAFPALARFQPEGFEWMTSDQETVSNMLGWTCVVVLFFVAVIFINRILIRFLCNVFSSPYKVSRRTLVFAFISSLISHSGVVVLSPSPEGNPLMLVSVRLRRSLDTASLLSFRRSRPLSLSTRFWHVMSVRLIRI